jgi:UDP-galactopyranose mutase
MFNAVIVGAGLAGSVMAERMASQLGWKVLLIEKRSHVGGNCYDERNEEGILVHRYGPHLFHTNNAEVVQYLQRFTEFFPYQHRVLANIGGKNVPIPFNLNTVHELFPKDHAEEMSNLLLKHYKYGSKVSILTLKKHIEPTLKELASFIYENLFLNYTIKQWGVAPEEIDEEVTARVPINISRDDRYFADRYQYVPQKGYTTLVSSILKHPNIKLLLNTNAKEILTLKDNKFTLCSVPFDGIVVYTGMIDELFDYRFGKLPYRSVKMQFETLDTPLYQNAATINYPNEYDFTRITEFKHIHPTHSNKTTILKEYPESYEDSVNEPYYPIFTKENKILYTKYKNIANSITNLIVLGRLGNYRYFNMDDIVAKALEVFENELSYT